MGIQDANTAGFVHGGVVMKICDEAAAIAAIRHCGGRVVTAGVDRMTFVEPVNVGELLTCSATVNAAWRTSMEVGVRVEAENPRTGERRHTSTAYLTMVALDDEGKPTPVPPLVAESDDERRRQREAELRRTNRLAERDQILADRDQLTSPPTGHTPSGYYSAAMGDVIAKILDGLENAGLMAYEVWWALVLGFAISAIVQAWVPRAADRGALSGGGLRAGRQGHRPRRRLVVVLLRGDRDRQLAVRRRAPRRRPRSPSSSPRPTSSGSSASCSGS